MARCQNAPMIAPLAPLALPADAARLLDGITVDAALATAVAHAFSQSPYLKRLLRTRKEVLPLIAELVFDAAFEAVMAQAAAATSTNFCAPPRPMSRCWWRSPTSAVPGRWRR